jgi:hypothetical protein
MADTRIIVTFGWAHRDPRTGLSLRECYMSVTGPDYESCRHQVTEQFGTQWAFDYVDGFNGQSAEEQAGVAKYRLSEVDFATGRVISTPVPTGDL